MLQRLSLLPLLITLAVAVSAGQQAAPTQLPLQARLQEKFADVSKDEIVRDRRDLKEARLAELSFEVVFSGEPEPTQRLQADNGRLP